MATTDMSPVQWEKQPDGSIALSNVTKFVRINKKGYWPDAEGRTDLGTGWARTVGINDGMYSADDEGLVQLGGGYVKSAKINGETKLPTSGGALDLGDKYVKKIILNDEEQETSSDGTVELKIEVTAEGYIRAISIDGQIYYPDDDGICVLDGIGGGEAPPVSADHNVYTGTEDPPASLGKDKDFYYKFT